MENIFIDLIITIFIYLIFPVIYRLGHGKVPKTQGKIIVLMNSIFCSIIFTTGELVIAFASRPKLERKQTDNIDKQLNMRFIVFFIVPSFLSFVDKPAPLYLIIYYLTSNVNGF